jgi:VWFA-related protein
MKLLKKNRGKKEDARSIPAKYRPLMSGAIRRIALVFSCFVVTALYSQTTDVSNSTLPIFQSKVRVVVVDVTVTDYNNQPVTGLRKEDFQIFERGNPQEISSFEEHNGADSRIGIAQNPGGPLPPDVFTNQSAVPFSDSVNILLLDALNTPLGDQSNVYIQMMAYLKSLQPGPRFAIFALNSRLRMVQGFTASPSQLISALNRKDWGGGPQSSPMARADAEDHVDAQLLKDMGEGLASSGAVSQTQRMQSQMKRIQTDTSFLTLQAFQQLARYLATFPGRKNVIWFSESFPISVHDSKFPQDLGPIKRYDLSETANLLAAAQVAIYPVNSAGLQPYGYTNASSITVPHLGPEFAASLAQEDSDRNARRGSMAEIAMDTGGKYRETNGFKEVLAEAVNDGAHYYTISYSPTDKKIDGSYRPITVKLKEGDYRLSYRRGYFADDTAGEINSDGSQSSAPLKFLMVHGIPDATQLFFKVRVAPQPQSSSHAEFAGDNTNFKGQALRYSVDFNLNAKGLDLSTTPNGMRRGDLEISLVAFDHDGNVLNWIARHLDLFYSADRYLALQQAGIPLHLEIDVPKGDNYLRTGVYEPSTRKAGTLEISLQNVVPIAAPAIEPSVAIASVPGPRPANPPVLQPSAPPSISFGSDTQEEPSGVSSTWVPPVVSANVAAYCDSLGEQDQHAAALASVCKFALSLVNRMPDIICDREMSRWWLTQSDSGPISNHDEITSKVAYRQGTEYYENVRINGAPANLDDKKWAGTTWSIGEFATGLEDIFLPQSQAKFSYEKAELLSSTATLVFKFIVKKKNNRTYALRTVSGKGASRTWYPAYSGQLWLDAKTFQLLKLERDTGPMLNEPIRLVQTEISYANIPLGDGSGFVLPRSSEVHTCLQNQEREYLRPQPYKFQQLAEIRRKGRDFDGCSAVT